MNWITDSIAANSNPSRAARKNIRHGMPSVGVALSRFRKVATATEIAAALNSPGECAA